MLESAALLTYLALVEKQSGSALCVIGMERVFQGEYSSLLQEILDKAFRSLIQKDLFIIGSVFQRQYDMHAYSNRLFLRSVTLDTHVIHVHELNSMSKK